MFIKDHLLEHPCVDCGNSNIAVLEFDHLRDKKYGISRMYRDGMAITRIQEEIDKCDVVCANCHRIRTYSRSDSWRSI